MDEQEPSPQYLKGFNVGYQIAKADPQLLEKLVKSFDQDKDYIYGLKMGKKQLDREKLLRQLKQINKKEKER
ncbi:MAG TPA: hypothetical protein VL832_24275 [Puia sp.]|nr:hypothetical protein [Puia sp.]